MSATSALHRFRELARNTTNEDIRQLAEGLTQLAEAVDALNQGQQWIKMRLSN